MPSEPITEPVAPARDADRAAWMRYHEAMIAWLAWQEDVERWRAGMERRQGALETRIDSAEAVLQLVPELIERLGPATLSPEHQRTVQAGVNRLHELTRRPHAAFYNDLREAFRVGTYKDIPEVRWEEVVGWFQQRITRAGGKTDTPPEQGSLF